MSAGGERNESRRSSGAVEGVLFNRREGRLRAGWRLLGWLLAVALAATVGVTLQQSLAATAPAGSPTALATVAGSVLTYAVLTGAAVEYARRVDHRPPAGLGLGGERSPRAFVVGLAIGLAMATAVFLVGIAFGFVRVVDVLAVDPTASVVPGATVEGATVGDLGPFVVIALLLAFYAAVGVTEEVLVRGYLLTNVADGLAGLGPVSERAAIAAATVGTGGLFGLVHLTNPHAGLRSAVAITAVGVVLGWTYVVSGDLWIPIGIHIAWNFSLAALFGFPVSGLTAPASVLGVAMSGDPRLTGGAFGPEAGLVMVVPLVLAVVVTALWVRRTTGSLGLQTVVARFGERQSSRNHEG